MYCDADTDQPARVNLDTVVDIHPSTPERPLPPNAFALESTTLGTLVFQCDKCDYAEWYSLLRELSPQICS